MAEPIETWRFVAARARVDKVRPRLTEEQAHELALQFAPLIPEIEKPIAPEVRLADALSSVIRVLAFSGRLTGEAADEGISGEYIRVALQNAGLRLVPAKNIVSV